RSGRRQGCESRAQGSRRAGVSAHGRVGARPCRSGWARGVARRGQGSRRQEFRDRAGTIGRVNSHSPRSPRPAQAPARRRRLLLVLTVAMLASWLLLSAPLPFSLLSGVTGLVALIALVPMIIQAVRDR